MILLHSHYAASPAPQCIFIDVIYSFHKDVLQEGWLLLARLCDLMKISHCKDWVVAHQAERVHCYTSFAMDMTQDPDPLPTIFGKCPCCGLPACLSFLSILKKLVLSGESPTVTKISYKCIALHWHLYSRSTKSSIGCFLFATLIITGARCLHNIASVLAAPLQ